ncbi:MAG: hypothetical protein ACRCTE_09260 [Cellulosilyticaceae bacterium]
MNKPKLKCFISLLCFMTGLLLLLIALFVNAFSYTTYTLLLAFGGILVVIGAIAFYIFYQDVKIITTLKSKTLTTLAHWTYMPLKIDTIKNALLEEKHSNISIIILSSLLLLLVDIGFILSNSSIYLIFSIIVGVLIVLFCITACTLIQFYYTHKLTHPVEAIISEDFIYFSGELYGLSRSLYFLEDIQVLEGTQVYLQFIYGSPGTPYDPIHVLTLPVPTEDLDIALKIKAHFSNRIMAK